MTFDASLSLLFAAVAFGYLVGTPGRLPCVNPPSCSPVELGG
ncbi:hypothetical protein BHAOGJBA_6256 [Methylobacterium hispanicum]|uniref:Uncharacterized protein n=1 Tax=Methylobacterium hispanicum TaxID=270350 RepID=A0AAV5A129_9HYPH|nr:hypothetical protein BHAOGJBA_6256 [Methylobacterium hispanicum]